MVIDITQTVNKEEERVYLKSLGNLEDFLIKEAESWSNADFRGIMWGHAHISLDTSLKILKATRMGLNPIQKIRMRMPSEAEIKTLLARIAYQIWNEERGFRLEFSFCLDEKGYYIDSKNQETEDFFKKIFFNTEN